MARRRHAAAAARGFRLQTCRRAAGSTSPGGGTPWQPGHRCCRATGPRPHFPWWLTTAPAARWRGAHATGRCGRTGSTARRQRPAAAPSLHLLPPRVSAPQRRQRQSAAAKRRPRRGRHHAARRRCMDAAPQPPCRCTLRGPRRCHSLAARPHSAAQPCCRRRRCRCRRHRHMPAPPTPRQHAMMLRDAPRGPPTRRCGPRTPCCTLPAHHPRPWAARCAFPLAAGAPNRWAMPCPPGHLRGWGQWGCHPGARPPQPHRAAPTR
eukprot:354227-Chlamydomonas_euryale.AAC.5